MIPGFKKVEVKEKPPFILGAFLKLLVILGELKEITCLFEAQLSWAL